ncbi:MAG TPA: hypothetical protein VG013_37480, partial [Gemmataceae bacterium]|nr:hypothetical protein [Gemmataceae bacterium]
MNRPLALAVVASLFLAPLPLRAEEPPHLEFARGLRERHYPDLALEWLKKQAQRTDLPPEVAARLPLEMARTQLDIATATPEIPQRLSLYVEARKQFEDFIAKNPQSPLLGTAKMEIARVALLQGRTQLGRALRENGAAKVSEAEKARKLLEDAAAQLDKVLPALKEQVDKVPTPTTPAQKAEKKELEDSYNQAELDKALTLFDQARAYVQEGEEATKARGKVLDQAIKDLGKVADGDDKSPYYWQAQAWLGRCMQENGDPKNARRKLADVISAAGKEADAGKRLARYFRIRVVRESPEVDEAKNLGKELKDAAGRWLKDYPTFVNTPEGYGVRFYLAEADAMLAGDAKTPAATKTAYYTEAKGYLKEVEQGESEFTSQARGLKMDIINAQGGLKGDVATLATFDDCYVRAQYEDAMLEKAIQAAIKEKREVPEEVRKQHLKTVIAALVRGLDLVQTKKQKAPEEEVNNARAALAYAYWEDGELQPAIAVGEELARMPARPPQSGRAAIYVLHAYSDLVADPQGNSLSDEQVKEIKERFRQFAEFAKKSWPTDSPGDVAHHELGVLAIREENYPAAVEELSAVRPGYSVAAKAQSQLAMAAFAAASKKANLPAGQKPWEEQAVNAAEGLPELPRGADAGTTFYYMRAKILLGDHYLQGKKYDQTVAVADPLLGRFDEFSFPNQEIRDQTRSALMTLSLWSKYGKALAEYEAGHQPEVSKIIDPLVVDAQGAKLPVLKTDSKLRWAVLGLGLRSDIQQGKMDDAQKVLDLLQSMAAANELEGGATATLVQLAQLLKGQVEEVRKKAPDQLPKTIDAFSKFLDKLTEQQQKGGKALAPDVLILLAQSYSSLDNHKTALEMLKGVSEPKADPP